MTNNPHIGQALSWKCQGMHRHIELTGSGRTKKPEIYPDRLCRAILHGLVKQMKSDDRLGCSFKADEVNFGREVEFAGDEMWSLNEIGAVQPQLKWTRKDFGPPDSCYLVTKDLNGASVHGG